MRHQTWMCMALLASLMLPGVGSAQGAKVLTTRTAGWKSPGVRGDISVPYLTTGTTAFIRGNYVGVRIYSATMVDEPYLPDVRPAYNLPFWGGIQAFSVRANGVMPTGLAVTRRELSPAVRPNAAMPVGTTLNSKGN